MRSVAFALCAAAAIAAPTFPLDWTAITTDSVQINQGGVVNPDGSVCCPATSPECKVQTAYELGKNYFAFSKNLSATKNPDNSGIVVDFTAGKEYQVEADGTCQAYCPLPHRADVMFPLEIDDNATLVNQNVPCGDYTCSQWQHTIVIPILNITMEADDFWVRPDATNGKSAPVWFVEYIEPLGEQIGQENTTYMQFQDMDGKTFPANAFTVKGADSCPQAQQCQGDDDNMMNNDNMPALFDGSVDPYFLRFGIRTATGRSVLFAQSRAQYKAKQAAAKTLPAEILAAIEQLPLHLQAAARRTAAARL